MVISVEELTQAAISYSAGQLSFDQARAIARRALREAEAAMEVVAFDRIRALCAAQADEEVSECSITVSG